MDILNWNEYFMELAKLTAKRSKDPKTQVGAVIVDPKNNHIVSIGYNGLPYGTDDNEYYWNDENKHQYVVHAEANAILNATTENLEGDILYVTMFPCNECAKLLAQKRIKKVVYLDDKFLSKECGKFALSIFKNANIEVEKYK